MCRRPFLDFKPVSGSFQVNPPYVEELIEATLHHIDRLLTDSQEPLRFADFLTVLYNISILGFISLVRKRFIVL